MIALAIQIMNDREKHPYWDTYPITTDEAQELSRVFPHVMHIQEAGDTGWITPWGDKPEGKLAIRFESEWENNRRYSIGIFQIN